MTSIERPRLHSAQMSVLRTLRRTEQARFSDLMKPTGLLSDVFKFHLKKLQSFELVEKLENGNYRLTSTGKEIANNLDKHKRRLQKQPKLSVLIVITRVNQSGEVEYLLQERWRNPFFGYWGFLSGPVGWGEDIEEAAAWELVKQTGLNAELSVRSFHRSRDYSEKPGDLLEDKLFAIVHGEAASGDLSSTWDGGHNQWMTIAELTNQEKFFELTLEAVEVLSTNQTYVSKKRTYEESSY